MPVPKAPSGGSGLYSASAWVGIDGDTCDTAILQTGIDFTINNGVVSYDGEAIICSLILGMCVEHLRIQPGASGTPNPHPISVASK